MSRQNRAFTLVELLVVIGIIAILVGILIPVISAARRQASMVVCTSNIRQITAAAMMHAQEHQGYLPLAGELVAEYSPGYEVNTFAAALGDRDRRRYSYAMAPDQSIYMVVPLPGALAPYMGYRDLPVDDWAKMDQAMNETEFWRRFICPASDSYSKAKSNSYDPEDKTLVGQGTMMSIRAESGMSSYPLTAAWSTNSDYGFNEGAFGYHYKPEYDTRRLRGNISRQRGSANLVLFTDAVPRKTAAYSWMKDPWICWTPLLDSTGPVTLGDVLEENGKAVEKEMFDVPRHENRINIGYADGHVDTLKIDKDALRDSYLLPP